MTPSSERSDVRPVLLTAWTPERPRAVTVVLHGGRADSYDSVTGRRLAALRMRPFADAIRRRSPDVAVWLLRYRYRGWNAPYAHPVEDVGFALTEAERRHGSTPVVLVGHSMGGRAALRAAAHPLVRGVAALAPWLPGREPVEQLAGRRLMVVHGDRDRTTSPAASALFAQRAARVADGVLLVRVTGDGHGMLRRARTWHGLTAGFVAATLTGEPLTGPPLESWVHARDRVESFPAADGTGGTPNGSSLLDSSVAPTE